MRKLVFITMALFGVLMISCEEEMLDPNDQNDNMTDTTGNTENNDPKTYLVLLSNNDTVPLYTSAVTWNDETRHLRQTNFQNDEYQFGFVFTFTTEPLATFEYETTENRFFYTEDGAAGKVNIYVSDFKTGKNYLVESGATVNYFFEETKYGYSFNSLTFTEESEASESFSASALVEFLVSK